MVPHSMNGAYADRGSQEVFAIRLLTQCIRRERVSHRGRYGARSKHKTRGRKMTVDTDEGKRAEDRLRRSEAYLAEGQRLSHTGSAAYNETEIHYWSEEASLI